MNALTPKEVAVIQMALTTFIEDMDAASKDVLLPFTPQTRNDMKEMLANAESSLLKIAAASGKLVRLDPYKEGDEKEFLTKES